MWKMSLLLKLELSELPLYQPIIIVILMFTYYGFSFFP